MNRKRKFNELYKGVFRNDKKSLLVDLKPLDRKLELEKLKKENENINPNIDREKELISRKKTLDVKLKVAKNVGFGSFFKRLREEVVDIFLSKEDYISFDGLFSNDINDLFNFRDSTSKLLLEREIVGLCNNNMSDVVNINNKMILSNFPINNMTNINSINNNLTTENINLQNNSTYLEDPDEEIIYEDESETIYKRKKKTNSKINLHETQGGNKLNFDYYKNNINNNLPLFTSSTNLKPYDGNNNNIFIPNHKEQFNKSFLEDSFDQNDFFNIMRLKHRKNRNVMSGISESGENNIVINNLNNY